MVTGIHNIRLYIAIFAILLGYIIHYHGIFYINATALDTQCYISVGSSEKCVTVHSRSNVTFDKHCSETPVHESPGGANLNMRETMETIHIAYASDHFIATKASIESVIKNSNAKDKLMFNIFECMDCVNTRPLKNLNELSAQIEQCGSRIQKHYYSYNEVDPYINKHYNGGNRLESPHNYVRYLLAEKLTGVDKCIWLDSDTLVLKDLVKFVNSVKTDKVIATFPAAIGDDEGMDYATVLKTLSMIGVKTSKEPEPRFNAGIIIYNLAKWRETNTTGNMLLMSDLNKRFRLWEVLGSQPPLVIMFSGSQFEHLNRSLYAGHLGSNRHIIIHEGVHFLHWNGPRKPWLECGLYKKLWIYGMIVNLQDYGHSNDWCIQYLFSFYFVKIGCLSLCITVSMLWFYRSIKQLHVKGK